MLILDRNNLPPTLGELKKEWRKEVRVEVARKMLLKEMNIDVIGEITGLSESEIIECNSGNKCGG